MRDVPNRKVIEEVIQMIPASMPEVRYGMAHAGMFQDGVSLHGDIRAAYITTPIGGTPKFLKVPGYLRHKLPPQKRGLKKPRCRIRLAMPTRCPSA